MARAEAPPLVPRLVEGVPPERLLAANLAALAACDADLARRLAQWRPDASSPMVTVRPAASGLPTVLCNRLHIHSAHDPAAEAAVQASRVPADAPRVMALGFGAGHLLATMLLREALQRLDVVPLSLPVLRAVAAAVDLRPLLCDPRLRLVTEERPALATPFVAVPPLLRLADPAYGELSRAALAALNLEAEAMVSARTGSRRQHA